MEKISKKQKKAQQVYWSFHNKALKGNRVKPSKT